jgi:hypothetical protein
MEPRYNSSICFTKIMGKAKIKSNTLHGQLAQLVRAPGSHPGGHWFESSTAHHPVQKVKLISHQKALVG